MRPRFALHTAVSQPRAQIFAELGSRETMDILALLTDTYPRYNDAESRAAVEQVGAALIRRDATLAEPVVIWIDSQSVHASASNDIYGLLCWACALLPLVVETPYKNELVHVLARLYDALLASPRVKAPLRVGGTTRVRRAFRAVCHLRVSSISAHNSLDLPTPPRYHRDAAKNAFHSSARNHDRRHNPPQNNIRACRDATQPRDAFVCDEPVLQGSFGVSDCRAPPCSRACINMCRTLWLTLKLQSSLDLFLATYVDSNAFDSVVLPSLEKALSRGAISGQSLSASRAV